MTNITNITEYLKSINITEGLTNLYGDTIIDYGAIVRDICQQQDTMLLVYAAYGTFVGAMYYTFHKDGHLQIGKYKLEAIWIINIMWVCLLIISALLVYQRM